MEIKYSSHSIWLWQTQMLIMPDCNLLTINIWENVSKLFDHAAQNSSNYLNGHCFLSIMLCVPVWNQDKISYLSVPLGYRMWKKKESKLELAATMIRKVMPEFQSREHVIILCDSWYTKQNLVCIVNEYPNLDLIGNARIDSVMYDLAPAHTGRIGRPSNYGKWLSVETRYYEQKTFWPFCNYMVRSCKGIEMLVNLINISYCAMKILPYQNEHFSEYRAKSVQEFRFELSQGIRSQIFFATFVKNIETHIKSNAMTKALKQLICQQVYHL